MRDLRSGCFDPTLYACAFGSRLCRRLDQGEGALFGLGGQSLERLSIVQQAPGNVAPGDVASKASGALRLCTTGARLFEQDRNGL